MSAGEPKLSRRDAMTADIKELIRVLMRVLDGGEVAREEIADLAFEAEDEALTASLNGAYIALLEFAHDRDLRRRDRARDAAMRRQLQDCLDDIVRRCDAP
jgi:hypothetical protein